MKTRVAILRCFLVAAVCLVAGALPAVSPAQEAQLVAGVAVRDITPPVGYRMSGYFSERLATGVHDPLQAKAIFLAQGGAQAALVFCDLSSISPEVAQQARQEAARRTGIPASNILVAATHSHTGPLYWGALRDHFHAQAVQQKGRDPYESVDYPALLVRRIVEAISEAKAAAAPAVLEAGAAQEARLSFNRRFRMKDGQVRTNPGKRNPEAIEPVGPIDPEVGLLQIRRTSGEPVAALTVFALHLDTVGGTEYSADYPYYLEQALKARYGPRFVSIFGEGTCGDINHIDVSHDGPQKGQEEARRIGTALAETVVAALPELDRIDRPAFAVRSSAVEVPLQRYSAEEVARARASMAKIGTAELPGLSGVEVYKIMAIERRKAATLPLEVQVFKLSDDVAVVGLPGEVFVELGLAIKAASPFRNTIVVELANDGPGYIPTRKAFQEGSYEVVNSRVQSGGGERMVELAVRLLDELAGRRP